ncbi:tRNA lysidine(34) synthetase TilS [Paracoccus sediminicola]|uniref:tRNA lysidine(34) synthetase TilS n=1 Tax=Paracoccus sediminicola TaxID=3017783 RepID=UPI0022EFFE3C|nr:tRNA lysidine(34) synthetase TilS [Paracoccus sediminicola]WBU56843.1 tRNA lysidine(34) synthetase TilS [Paracoccus sediminicola]
MTAVPETVTLRAFAALDQLSAGASHLGIALSGGGDSVALLRLASDWAARSGVRLSAATVDHGLRPESAREAGFAGQSAATLGIAHEVLPWRDFTHDGNLMANARAARLRLLGAWARRQGIAAVALGHTRDDVAETLLMRLSRGAGIDGLAAMSARREAEGMLWLRPLLEIGREELRDWLRHQGATWIEDPSNENLSFERARIRRAMATLGLDPAQLAQSAGHLATARAALDAAMAPLLAGAEAQAGALRLDRAAFDAAAMELRRRLIVAAVRFVTGAAYPPRRAGVENALKSLENGARVTLDGAVLDPGRILLIHREPAAALRGVLSGDLWDDRWRIGGLQPGDSVTAAGDDLSGADWRSAGHTHLEAQAMPAVMRGEMRVLPALAPQQGVSAEPLRNMTDFRRILLGH